MAKKKNYVPLILLGVAVVGGGGYLLYNQMQKKKLANESEEITNDIKQTLTPSVTAGVVTQETIPRYANPYPTVTPQRKPIKRTAGAFPVRSMPRVNPFSLAPKKVVPLNPLAWAR